MRTKETMVAWEEESGRMAGELAKAEKRTAAEAKAAQLEKELAKANARVLESQRGQLAAMRANKASEAAHKATLQSKQWDRGKKSVSTLQSKQWDRVKKCT